MRRSEREGNADLPSGTRYAELWQVAGVEFTNGEQPGQEGKHNT